MIKKIISFILSVCFTFSFSACKKIDVTFSDTAADNIKNSAVQLMDYYKAQSGLSSTDDLCDIPLTEQSYTGETVLSATNIRLIRTAKYFSYSLDYEKFFLRLKGEYIKFYPLYEDALNGKASLFCEIWLLLRSLGKTNEEFCGYDFAAAGIYNNSSLASYMDIYTVPLMLTAMKGQSAPKDARFDKDALINFLTGSVLDDGGWGYDGESDCDMTAMVLLGLNEYYNYSAEVKTICDTAAATLLTFKNTDNTFNSAYLPKSISSTAVAYSALSIIKKDIFSSAKTDKINPADIFGDFKNADGGYRASIDDAPGDIFSCNDVLTALYYIHKYFTDGEGYAYMSIRMDTLAKTLDTLSEAYKNIVPADGAFLDAVEVKISQGETVMSLLKKTARDYSVLIDASNLYVFSIAGIAEKDFGASSGWIVYVNGVFLQSGTSSVYVKENDFVEWHYSLQSGDVSAIFKG